MEARQWKRPAHCGQRKPTRCLHHELLESSSEICSPGASPCEPPLLQSRSSVSRRRGLAAHSTHVCGCRLPASDASSRRGRACAGAYERQLLFVSSDGGARRSDSVSRSARVSAERRNPRGLHAIHGSTFGASAAAGLLRSLVRGRHGAELRPSVDRIFASVAGHVRLPIVASNSTQIP